MFEVYVLSAEAWKLITSIINNCSTKCGFLVINDNNALKLTEDEENDWHSLQPLGVKSDGYMT